MTTKEMITPPGKQQIHQPLLQVDPCCLADIQGQEFSHTGHVVFRRVADRWPFVAGMAESSMTPNDAHDILAYFVAHPEEFEFFKSVKLRRHKRQKQASLHLRDAANYHANLISAIAKSRLNLELTSGEPPSPAREDLVAIGRAQDEIPDDQPLPLIWQAEQGATPTAMAVPGGDEDDKDTQDDKSSVGESGSLMREFLNRLAVSRDVEFIYPPELVETSPATPGTTAAASWLYGMLYAIDYPEQAPGAGREELARLHVSLPKVVLDLGRLVVTCSVDDRGEASSWSPSDFSVMVDVEAKTVWLVCDRDVADSLRILNSHDGQAGDLAAVRRQFDSQRMDLALLFTHISDWTYCHNTWPVMKSRISQSCMNLGLHLRHL